MTELEYQAACAFSFLAVGAVGYCFYALVGEKRQGVSLFFADLACCFTYGLLLVAVSLLLFKGRLDYFSVLSFAVGWLICRLTMGEALSRIAKKTRGLWKRQTEKAKAKWNNCKISVHTNRKRRSLKKIERARRKGDKNGKQHKKRTDKKNRKYAGLGKRQKNGSRPYSRGLQKRNVGSVQR